VAFSRVQGAPGLGSRACFYEVLPPARFHYDVKMGDRSVYKEITSVLVPVRDIIVHPQLSVVGTIQKDLALLQLLYPVNFTMTIQPICIPQKTFRVEAGTTLWGSFGL
uniref:Peptidase S1 domain-containing protein n=1 Tax=Panthera tigris altaica TaxID=74533 RepID=A0A8C9K287_PANTA